MKKAIHYLTIGISILVLTSCGSEQTEIVQPTELSAPKYDIAEEEKLETPNKAQLVEYAIYSEESYTEEIVETVLLDIYKKNKNKDLFDKYDAPTVFAAYLFTSSASMQQDKSSWIGMLMKGPNDYEPRITFNNSKINSLQGLNNDKKSADEIAYDALVQYLSEHNAELCIIYNEIDAMEEDSRNKAYTKYPNYDYPQHYDYSTKLKDEGRENILNEYDMHDSIYIKIIVFGMNYCE